MRLNKFQVTTVLYFKSGQSKKVDWIEERLVKKVKGEKAEVTEPLTLDEADAFFQGKFKEWKDNGSTIVRKNARAVNSMIPFAEVEYATVEVKLIDDIFNNTTIPDGEFDRGPEPIPPVPPKPTPAPPRSIQDHPAFKFKA